VFKRDLITLLTPKLSNGPVLNYNNVNVVIIVPTIVLPVKPEDIPTTKSPVNEFNVKRYQIIRGRKCDKYRS
jgi:hypothetical protein